MSRVWRIGGVVVAACLIGGPSGMAEERAAVRAVPGKVFNARMFEAQGRVNSISWVERRVTIEGKSYRLAKEVRVLDGKGRVIASDSAVRLLRGRTVGFMLGNDEQGEPVIEALLLLSPR